MAKVVIINGLPQSGKDTFVGLCSEFGQNKGVTVHNLLTSTPAKQALGLLGWNGEKDNTSRNMLCDLMRMSETFDGVFKYICKEISKIDDNPSQNNIVFVHCREWGNVERYKKAFDAITLFIDRDVLLKDSSNDSDRNAELNMHEYDYKVWNGWGLEELKHSAEQFMINTVLRRHKHDGIIV